MSHTPNGDTAADLAVRIGNLGVTDNFASLSHPTHPTHGLVQSPNLAGAYPSVQTPSRGQPQDPYAGVDYGQYQAFYPTALPSGNMLDSPFSQTANSASASYGYANGAHEMLSPNLGSDQFEYTSLGGSYAQDARGMHQGASAAFGQQQHGRGNVFRALQGQQQAGQQQQTLQQAQVQALQQASAAQYFGGYQQDGRPYWMTPQGVFTQRESRKDGQHVTHPLQSPGPHTPIRAQHGQQGSHTPFSAHDYMSSPSQVPYGLGSPHTPSFNPAQPPGSPYGMHHPQGPYGITTPFSPMGSVFGHGGHGHGHGHGQGHSNRYRRNYEGNMHGSAILEDFRLNKMNKKWELADVWGHVSEFAGDQHGSRFIQQRLETANIEDRQKLFDEIMPDAYALMTDVFGNYVTQKMFENGDQRQKAALAKEMEGKVLSLSMQMYGCRVVQKALEHVLVDQREKLVSELEGHILECVKSNNANHVVQRVITLNPPQSIVDSFTGHVEELALHPYGCRVLQKVFECLPEKMKRTLLEEMHKCTYKLIEDQFGNYVIQSVIICGDEKDRARVLAKMKGQIVLLSKHKFASNVVEKAIIHSSRNDKREIVKELIDMQPNGINKVAALLRDPIANFPVQTALTYAERPQRQELFDIIYPLVLNIRHTPVGKRLEVKINEMESESFKPSLDKLVAASSHPLSSSISTNGTEASQIGSSSTRVTSPDRERGTLRASSSAPPSMKNKGDGAEDVVAASSADDQKLIDLLH